MQFVTTLHHMSPGDTIRCRNQVTRPDVPCLDVGTLTVCPASYDQAHEIVRALVRWLFDREAAAAIAAGRASEIASIDVSDMFERLWDEIQGGPV